MHIGAGAVVTGWRLLLSSAHSKHGGDVGYIQSGNIQTPKRDGSARRVNRNWLPIGYQKRKLPKQKGRIIADAA